jgi:hypothetical protein
MLSQIYIQRQGDSELFLDFYNQFKSLSGEALLKQCESARRVGIVGSHTHGIRLVALYKGCLVRNIPSGICFEDNCLISFKDS